MLFTLLSWLIWLIVGIFSILPNWNIPAEYIDPVMEVLSYVFAFEGLLPISVLFHCLAYILLFETTIWFSRMVLSVWNWFRGAGGINI